MPDGREVHTCGIVTTKQQPETAKQSTELSSYYADKLLIYLRNSKLTGPAVRVS